MEIFVAGVSFEDGSSELWLTAEDFDAEGRAKVRFLKAAGVSTAACHQLQLFDGEELIGTR